MVSRIIRALGFGRRNYNVDDEGIQTSHNDFPEVEQPDTIETQLVPNIYAGALVLA